MKTLCLICILGAALLAVVISTVITMNRASQKLDKQLRDLERSEHFRALTKRIKR